MKQQLIDMLELQDRMNSKVHPAWREQHYEWYRAIWTECAELMDHFGWKWWKKQTPDLPQIQLEIVDIWHFGMSIQLQHSQDYDALAEQLLSQWHSANTTTDFRVAVEQLANDVLTSQAMSIPLFCQLMTLTDFSADELYRQYIGKNVLNFFRQDHGYKEGTYHKKWHGKEDNEHLAEVLATLDVSAGHLQEQVYQALEKRYPR
jgi:dimeric dUTPase (all-alpha-NTP-PPase superfamily)